MTTSITHIAGPALTWDGRYVRQRCAWCGAILIDADLTIIQVPIEDAGRPLATWPFDAFVRVEDVGFATSYSIVKAEPSEIDPTHTRPQAGCCIVARPERDRMKHPLNALGAALHVEVERVWPAPPGTDTAQRQALALCEEVGEIARAILKRSHAQRSHDGRPKGLTADEWTAELHVEIGQVIGVALQLAHIEGVDIDAQMMQTLELLRSRPCIDASGARS
jgi:NTP pyrophosphatase (non-canonical NTP hydrolase)